MNPIKFVPLSDMKWKALMITDKAIVLSNKKYSSLESMAKNLQGVGTLEDKEEFRYQSLEELSFLSNGENLNLKKLNFKKKPVSVSVSLNDINLIEQIVNLVQQNGEFEKTEEKANTLTVVQGSLIKIAGSIIATALFYFIANSMASGEELNTDGRKGFLKEILVTILDTIGATGVLLIGVLITSIFIYQLVQKLKVPTSLIKLRRKKV